MPENKKSKIEHENVLEHEEELVEESKFFVPPYAGTDAKKKEFDFPHSYGDNKIVLLVRDPHWTYAYWEITEGKYKEVRDILGSAFNDSKEILRGYDTTSKPWKSFDVTVSYGARSWYVNVPESNRTYIVDVGFLSPDGRFIAMARSNAVTTPRDAMSEVIDEEWMTVNFERVYAISGGFGVGKSSGEIRELMKKHLFELKASGWLASSSSPLGRRTQ
jgi:uncharacterized protein